MPQLAETGYMAFPFRITSSGAASSKRRDHVREQIRQVLFTSPKERVFRPDFGAGVWQFVFEPNTATIWEMVEKRLTASLIEALQGEVDPKTLEVDVGGQDDRLVITVRYALAAIGATEEHTFTASGGQSGG